MWNLGTTCAHLMGSNGSLVFEYLCLIAAFFAASIGNQMVCSIELQSSLLGVHGSRRMVFECMHIPNLQREPLLAHELDVQRLLGRG
ncbi:hypothetical protein B0T20DRAFT_271644 [Sordaria brevicollis]|uniref:Uncharacterized protein n=1 Tax=Sordaria brevicollis TaxID=83679 RepID=A0AAE0PAV5_SORBR|nr:hypothetical protein B0T20DRAFT_271644 [Sordaria brevicollis]